MAHLACATHKRRVVYLIDANGLGIARHRNGDGSPCYSTNFTSKGRLIPASDLLTTNLVYQKEN